MARKSMASQKKPSKRSSGARVRGGKAGPGGMNRAAGYSGPGRKHEGSMC